jgi:outer membrane protein assembly factor BamB
MFSNRLRLFARPSSRRVRRRMGVAALLLCGLGTPIGLSLRAAHAQDAVPAANSAGGKVDAPMAVEWKFTGTPFSGNIAAPVVSSDTAYFASGGVVYAVDLASGAQKWRYPVVGSLPRAIFYTPTYSDGTVFLSTGEGLSALDATTGKLKYPSFVIPNGAATSPIVIGDAVYFGGGNGRIFALNAKTGDPVSATFRNGVNLQTDIAGNMTTANGMLYVITANQVMHAVDALTGNQRWGVRLEGETRGAIVVPAGETLYVAVGSALQAFRATSGIQRWAIGTPHPITAPPVVDSDGTAYIVTSDRAVYAITGKSVRAESVWKKTIPVVDTNVVAQPVIADDLLIVATEGGGLWAFDRATGALRWNYLLHPSATENQPLPLRAGVSAHPITVGDTLYALSDDGTLTAFRHNAEDVTPPAITPIRPMQGDYVNGQPPFTIRARVLDEGSGLNVETMSVKLDDNQVPLQKILGVGTNGFIFDNATGELQYTIYPRSGNEVGRSTSLGDGHHTVTISVKDWMGNTATRSWSFAVDDTIKRGGTGTQTGGRPGGFPGRGGAGGGKGGGGE